MGRLSLTSATALLVVLAGCATIPNARKLSTGQSGKSPVVETADHASSTLPPPQELPSISRFPGDDEKLQRQVAVEGQIGGTPLVAGNKVVLVQNGRPTYDLMEQAILAAKENISLESYTIEGDAIGTAIVDLLIEKHRQGVSVEVIYDSYGSK